MPMAVGTDVLVPAPGYVNSGPMIQSRGQVGLSIVHSNIYSDSGSFGTFFNHLSKILLPPGTFVARGDVVAKSGMSGTPIPHLHFNNWLSFAFVNESGFFDFYQPEFEITPKTSGFWYPDEFTWYSAPIRTSLNGKNLWTRLNKPVFYE
jgi:murein DD-endopeptidase MepM/ murein hydrolase activator NlpD